MERKTLPTDPEVTNRIREVWRELEGHTKSSDPLNRDDMAAAYVAGEYGFPVTSKWSASGSTPS
jgi:hypothetical protein